MDEREFNGLADAMLSRLERAVEESGAELDLELKAGGILELEFENGSKIIINRHTAAREIWVAAKSGGYHFKPEGSRWIASRDNAELLAVLERCMAEQSGTPVKLQLGD